MSEGADTGGEDKALAAKRLRLRNLSLLGALLFFVLMVYLVTILKMKL